jgi:hypothetical protein
MAKRKTKAASKAKPKRAPRINQLDTAGSDDGCWTLAKRKPRKRRAA